MIKRALTEEERQRSYAKYYFTPMAQPSKLLMAQCRHRIPPEEALRPEAVRRLFDWDGEQNKVGWSILDSGAGYVASRVDMPGVSPEMIAWWFAWHPLESLRYMIWYPGRHFSAGLSEQDRQKILDPQVGIEQKISDVTHIIQEDSRENDALTEIPKPFCICFRRPEEMGIPAEWIGYPDRGCVLLASPPLKPDGSLPDRPRIMMHYARATGDGVAFCSRFWMGGYVLRDGRAEAVGVGTPTPEDAPGRLLLHCVREYTNLASFLPGLYREMGGRLEP